MSYLNLMNPWMVGISLYCVVSMVGMYLMIRHSKHSAIVILDFDLKVEIACAILCAPLLMPVILMMLGIYYVAGADEKEHADMGMYFQSALILIVFSTLSIATAYFPIDNTNRQPPQNACECVK